MKRAVIFSLTFISLILLVTATLAISATGEKPTVVTTTTILGSIVKDLAGNSVEVMIIASPAVCPAHYDIKPSDVYAFSKADLILYHGFEPWISSLVESSGTKAPLVKVSGSWNTPKGVENYYTKVANILKEKLGLDVSEKLNSVLAELNETKLILKNKAEAVGASNVKVIVMKWQKPYVSWLGFNVVADFGPPEKLSSADVENLIEKGKTEGVMLVISNLQSGTIFGESLASEIGAVHVVLTNFPETEPDLKTLTDVLERNGETLFKAVELYEAKLAAIKATSELEFYKILSYSLIVVAVVEAAIVGYAVRRRS